MHCLAARASSATMPPNSGAAMPPPAMWHAGFVLRLAQMLFFFSWRLVEELDYCVCPTAFSLTLEIESPGFKIDAVYVPILLFAS